MDFQEILYEVDDGVATITLNRPQRLNAFTNRMLDEWTAAIDRVRDDDGVRAVVITGSGRGFCAGMDMASMADIRFAAEALDIGYVLRVLPADDLLAETTAFARQLADGPAVAIQLAKRLVYRSLETDLDHALDLAQSAMALAQSTEDAREGPRAFVERRSPRFQGH